MIRNKWEGFTLIELLIVVAIIAILAAIAIPNFLQAQIRAKVANMKAGMASTATALEAYAVDNNGYPDSGGFTIDKNVTTPIPYITSVPRDIFDIHPNDPNGYYAIGWNHESSNYGWYINTADGNPNTDTYIPAGVSNPTNIQYCLFSEGPGEGLALSMGSKLGGNGYHWYNVGDPVVSGGTGYDEVCQPYRYWYDPTNGTVSIGYIVRVQGGTNSP